MSVMQSTPIPQVFVLWHPRCRLGEPLARKIYNWLRPGNGLGPEVFYRSLPAPTEKTSTKKRHGNAKPAADEVGSRLPPLLPGEKRFGSETAPKARRHASNVQFILPLIDENMVADSSWRHWLADLAKR